MVVLPNKESLKRLKQQRLNYPSKNIKKVKKKKNQNQYLMANKGQTRHSENENQFLLYRGSGKLKRKPPLKNSELHCTS